MFHQFQCKNANWVHFIVGRKQNWITVKEAKYQNRLRYFNLGRTEQVMLM